MGLPSTNTDAHRRAVVAVVVAVAVAAVVAVVAAVAVVTAAARGGERKRGATKIKMAKSQSPRGPQT